MRRLFALLLPLLLLATACSDKPSPPQGGPVFRSLSPLEAKALVAQRSDLKLIDLREPQELVEGSIPGSQLMPFRALAQGEATLPKGPPLLLICAVGGRSYMVGQYFSRNGYPEIYNLEGGISAWKQAGLPLEHR
ncbi:MAG: rhodanese-like domain-containing protein [Thermodesulfobacteriota bacterium]